MAKRPPPGGEEDGSAALFFVLAILGCVVVPWTLAMLWGIFSYGKRQVEESFPTTTEGGNRVRQCQTQAMASRRSADINKLKSRSTMLTRGFFIRIAVLALLWCWLVYIIVQVRSVMATSKLYQNFDPYEILELSRSATSADIKKTYRKLSLKYHPDRNQGNPAAADKFILMKKAYDALTDPTARRNFKLYGNPDGPVRMEMGMALPAVSKEMQNVVLILFVLFFILGIPLTFLWFMSGGESVLPNGLLQSTMEMLVNTMTDKMSAQTALEYLMRSAETRKACCAAPATPAAAQALEALQKELLPGGSMFDKPSKKKGAEQPDVEKVPIKAELFYLAHVRRRRDLLAAAGDDSLILELEALLKSWRTVTLAMADLAARQGFGDATIAALELHRCLVQAIEPGHSLGPTAAPLLQVPHLSPEHVKTLRKKKKAMGMLEFLDLPLDELQSQLEGCELDSHQVADAREFVAVAPRLAIKSSKVYVPGEDEGDVCMGDLATLEVTLERTHLREDEAAGAVHTPHFPSASMREAWWVIFSPGGGSKARCVRVVEPEREFTASLKFKVPNAKKCRCRILLACEAYDGLDIEDKIVFEASEAKEEQSDASGQEDDDIELSEPGE